VNRNKRSVEFEAAVGEDGNIVVPAAVLQQLRHVGQGKLHVRLSATDLAADLKSRNVDEEEVEDIAARQLESREQVVKFLMSEGALKLSASFSRVRRGKGR
jgi:hypothetical protein